MTTDATAMDYSLQAVGGGVMPSPVTNDSSPVRRFVVLRHDVAESAHYDLMIDDGQRLATWQCPSPPENVRTGTMQCRRIDDHRRIYLDYEGPISGDRGRVARHDAGTCRVLVAREDYFEALFTGHWISGRFALIRQVDGQLWLFRSISE